MKASMFKPDFVLPPFSKPHSAKVSFVSSNCTIICKTRDTRQDTKSALDGFVSITKKTNEQTKQKQNKMKN